MELFFISSQRRMSCNYLNELSYTLESHCEELNSRLFDNLTLTATGPWEFSVATEAIIHFCRIVAVQSLALTRFWCDSTIQMI